MSRPPASAYVLTALVGTATAAAIGALAGWLRADDGGWVRNFVVFAVVLLPVCLSLAWVAFVAWRAPVRDAHAEDNVEGRWITEATSGAWSDTIVAAGVALAAVSVGGIETSGTAVLVGVIVLGFVDTAVRYLLLKRRGA